MALKIIGAGFGRTGTKSLKRAIDMLGLGPCYHMSEVFGHPDHLPVWQAVTRGESVDWEALLDGYDSIVDWPGCTFWRQLSEVFPDAKILLSSRDADSWHKSVCNTIYHRMTMTPGPGAPPTFAGFQAMAKDLILDGTFHGKILDAEYAKGIFEANNAAVRAEVPSDRLIDYVVGSGWEPLCEGLGVAVPDEPFPRTNSTAEYRGKIGLDPV